MSDQAKEPKRPGLRVKVKFAGKGVYTPPPTEEEGKETPEEKEHGQRSED